MQLEITIPLFPLGLVLLPEMVLPLHIFEERYKKMIGQCLDQNQEFGIVYFDGTRIQEAGCTARILRVLKRYDDGRMDIVTKGEKRFRIMNVSDTEAYLQARIVYFSDELEEETEEFEKLASEGVEFSKQLDALEGKKGDYSFVENLDFRLISFLISGNDGFTQEEKQRFLEMTSTRDRLKKSVESLEKIVERTRITQDIQRIIGGNGNIAGDLGDLKEGLG